jgi:phage-related protein
MAQPTWRVEFYEKENGEVPVQVFLDALTDKMIAKSLREISLLEERGNLLREPHSKAMGDGLFELRIKQSSNISRIFYFFFIGKRIILTNGIIKKTQKTPKEALKEAIKYKIDFEERNK